MTSNLSVWSIALVLTFATSPIFGSDNLAGLDLRLVQVFGEGQLTEEKADTVPNKWIVGLRENGKIDSSLLEKNLSVVGSGVVELDGQKSSWSGTPKQILIHLEVKSKYDQMRVLMIIDIDLEPVINESYYIGNETISQTTSFTNGPSHTDAHTFRTKWRVVPSGIKKDDSSDVWKEVSDMASEKPLREITQNGKPQESPKANDRDTQSTSGDKDSTLEALSRIKTAIEINDWKEAVKDAKNGTDAAKYSKALADAKTLSKQIATLNDFAKVGSKSLNPVDTLREGQTDKVIAETRALIDKGESVKERFQAELSMLRGVASGSANDYSNSAITNLINNINHEQLANHFTNRVESIRQQQGNAAANAEEARIHEGIENAARGTLRAKELIKN